MFHRRSIAHRHHNMSIIQSPCRVAALNDSQVIIDLDSTAFNERQDLEDDDDVIRNKEFIFCVMCNSFIDSYDGIYVRHCLHQVCIDCIRKNILECTDVKVKCPGDGCEYFLQDCEIRSMLTPAEHQIHSKKYSLTNNGDRIEASDQNINLYQELLYLEAQGIIRTTEKFECQICFTDIEPFDGMMIRDCFHRFCIDCVRGTINTCEEAAIQCPATDCGLFIHDREVRSLLTQSEFDKYNARILRIAESMTPNSYHCKLANCEGVELHQFVN